MCPHYCHFTGGILKLKQVTGRVHCDIQHYIVGLISGVAPCCLVIVLNGAFSGPMKKLR
ncbi:hypothetical protein DFH29DRAFT_795133 [Suillus ampliporus]|nr:hypothetical protein DFH29DRAFT_795133 [Suillus ampliporus]